MEGTYSNLFCVAQFGDVGQGHINMQVSLLDRVCQDLGLDLNDHVSDIVRYSLRRAGSETYTTLLDFHLALPDDNHRSSIPIPVVPYTIAITAIPTAVTRRGMRKQVQCDFAAAAAAAAGSGLMGRSSEQESVRGEMNSLDEVDERGSRRRHGGQQVDHRSFV